MKAQVHLATFKDKDLVRHLGELVRQDREHTASLLGCIAEIDRRELWAKQGFPSMFVFCVARFHMSESTASKRIGAARAARRFPLLFEAVARGEIHLSGIHRLKAHLTQENHRQVIAAAKHRTLQQIEQLVASLAPKPDVRSSVRALPARTAPPVSAAPAAPAVPAAAMQEEVSRPPVPPLRAPDPKPLAPRRYKLTVTIDQEAHDQLRQLQDLLAHGVPNGDPALIVKRALRALLDRTLKKKSAVTNNPRASSEEPGANSQDTRASSDERRRGTGGPGSHEKCRAGGGLGSDERRRSAGAPGVSAVGPGSSAAEPRRSDKQPAPGSPSKQQPRNRRRQAIAAAVRRAVWQRDAGRCCFVGSDGRRCHATRGLEFAHVTAWSRGGADTADNLRLRCRNHNTHEANRDFGLAFMSRRRQQPTQRAARAAESVPAPA